MLKAPHASMPWLIHSGVQGRWAVSQLTRLRQVDQRPAEEPGADGKTFLVCGGDSHVVYKAAQSFAAAGMTKFAQRFRLNLADALAGDVEVLPHLFERMFAIDTDAKAFAQDFLFARREGLQDLQRLLLQIELHRRLKGRNHLFILDEVTQMAVLVLTDGGFEGDRFFRNFEHLTHLFHWHFHALSDFLRRGLAP